MRSILLNNIADMDVLSKDQALLAEADRYSDTAFKNLAWVPSIQGTRGDVLAALSREEEGLARLKQALARQKESEDKATDACLIALVEARCGGSEESVKYLSLARSLDANCMLIRQAERAHYLANKGE